MDKPRPCECTRSYEEATYNRSAYKKEWNRQHPEKLRQYSEARKKRYQTDPKFRERVRTQQRAIEAKNRGRQREYVRRSAIKRRLRVLEIIGGNNGIRCVKCGCDIIELLEINHVRGGGSKEIRVSGGGTWTRQILAGKRGVKDLDLRCIVCNALHRVALKSPDLASRFTVRWKS